MLIGAIRAGCLVRARTFPKSRYSRYRTYTARSAGLSVPERQEKVFGTFQNAVTGPSVRNSRENGNDGVAGSSVQAALRGSYSRVQQLGAAVKESSEVTKENRRNFRVPTRGARTSILPRPPAARAPLNGPRRSLDSARR